MSKFHSTSLVRSGASLAALIVACTLTCFAQPITPWTFVSPDADYITAIEWRKIVSSPYSELLKGEIAPDALEALNALNVIDGVDRLIVERSGQKLLVVLNGDFDLKHLRELAMDDGATSRKYRGVELLLSADGDATAMALVNEHTVLLGLAETLIVAADRMQGEGVHTRPPSELHDLFIYENSPTPVLKALIVAYDLSERVRVTAVLKAISNETAKALRDNVGAPGLTATQSGEQVRITGQIDPDEFADTAGGWTAGFERLGRSIQPPPKKAPEPVAKKDAPPAKVRIIGLDDGVREVLLGPAAPGQAIRAPEPQPQMNADKMHPQMNPDKRAPD